MFCLWEILCLPELKHAGRFVSPSPDLLFSTFNIRSDRSTQDKWTARDMQILKTVSLYLWVDSKSCFSALSPKMFSLTWATLNCYCRSRLERHGYDTHASGWKVLSSLFSCMDSMDRVRNLNPIPPTSLLMSNHYVKALHLKGVGPSTPSIGR